nr:transposase domain-containing protein [Belnapia arida]
MSRPGSSMIRTTVSRDQTASTNMARTHGPTRWYAFSRFLTDSRICLTNNAAERELRGMALGRKAWMFAGSDRGGERAAAIYSLIATAKLNDVDPRAWLADVLARIADHLASRLHELLSWHWKAARTTKTANAA